MAYVGFDALVKKGVPPGAAANIGRNKYGKKRFQRAAAKGKKMRGMKPRPGYKAGKQADDLERA
jgi:hypothetical protein